MTKNKGLKRAVYTARVKIAEVDGSYYYPGDETTLENLDPDYIGMALAKFYYTPDDWNNVPQAVKDAYEKYK